MIATVLGHQERPTFAAAFSILGTTDFLTAADRRKALVTRHEVYSGKRQVSEPRLGVGTWKPMI